MLYDQYLNKFLWAKACNTVIYIQNRVPHRALGKITPEEVFSRKKPDVTHFKIFGSIAYCHMPDEKRTKLDQTAKKGFFVGYSETSKAFKIYIPSNKKIIVRRDIKFMEDRALRCLARCQHVIRTNQQRQDEELVYPPTISHRTNKEVRQTLRDAENFIGDPRTNRREHRQSDKHQALVAKVVEPSSYQEVTQHQVWVDAMVEKYNSIMTNDVWEVVSSPMDRSVVGSRLIYKIKYKARFVEKGYVQKG
eukprot:PITA_27760